MKKYTIEVTKKETTTTTSTIEITEAQYNAMNAATSRLVAIMQEKGKASLTAEEKAKGFASLDVELQINALRNATWKFKERKQIERLNQFCQDHLTIRVPGTTARAEVRPVIYRTREGIILSLDGLNVPCIALIGVSKDGHTACKLITKGRNVTNELSTAYGRRQLKEWITDKVKAGLTSAINDMLHGITIDDIIKLMMKEGRASSFKDARSITEEMAEFAGLDYDTIKAEAKQLRTCKVTQKAVKTA